MQKENILDKMKHIELQQALKERIDEIEGIILLEMPKKHPYKSMTRVNLLHAIGHFRTHLDRITGECLIPDKNG